MNKKTAWAASLTALFPLLIIGFVVWKGLSPTQKPQVLAKKVISSDTSQSELGVISSSGVPLGNLGDGSSSSQGATIGNNSSSPQSTFNSGTSTTTSSSTAGSSSSGGSKATLDPKQFSQYDQYKDSKNALFGEVATGSGDEAKAGKTLLVNYSGWLTSGVMFDQNISSDKPFSFVLGAGTVIPGWEQGLTGMKVGGERLVIVPPAVGYGATGQGPIPGNAVLVFDVKLLSVK